MSIVDDKRFMSRFGADRGPQIEQLISYITLLGFTGKDLVAIGGKMERQKEKNIALHNEEIVKQFKFELIGQDRDVNHRGRFKIKNPYGTYHVQCQSFWHGEVKNTKTRVKKNYFVNYCPTVGKGYIPEVKQAILAIANGVITLDF